MNNPFKNLFHKKNAAPRTVTRQSVIGDILDADPATAPYFTEIGMHCLGCPASRGESIEQACAVHGVEVEPLVERLNAHFAGR